MEKPTTSGQEVANAANVRVVFMADVYWCLCCHDGCRVSGVTDKIIEGGKYVEVESKPNYGC